MATVRRATGEETRTAEISGEVLFRNVPVSFDGDAGLVESGDYEFFVGIRSDPFFFDLEGFQHDFEFTGEDFFIDKNVFSIVLELPNTALGEGQIGFWCRVLGPEDGDLSQIDRMGRPLTNMLYTEGEDKNAFNQVGPEQDRDLFLERFEAVLEANGYGSGEARTVAETLLPDVLAYDHRAARGFPNAASSTTTSSTPRWICSLTGESPPTVSLPTEIYGTLPLPGCRPPPRPDGSTEGGR